MASPSPQVLSLVTAFLSEHGLDTTAKALRKELKRKNIITEPETTGSRPKLQSIFESWQKQEAQSSTSEEESLEEGDGATSVSSAGSSSATDHESSDGTSNEESASEPDFAPESESEVEVTKAKPKKTRTKKREPSLAVSSSSSSDSDADDETEETPKPKPVRQKSQTATSQNRPTNNLKRKANSNAAGSSSSDSESSTDDRATKRAKVDPEDGVSSSGASSSSEDRSSDAEGSSDEDEEDTADSSSDGEQDEAASADEGESETIQPKSFSRLMNGVAEAPSDSSSNTVTGDLVDREESLDGPEAAQSVNKKKSILKKHVGARPTPLAQLSADTGADSHVSNAYQSYAYADRAYNDLSVTRGKGFTKEKNKKKRGSYRGGAIDISGGKSFKFDD